MGEVRIDRSPHERTVDSSFPVDEAAASWDAPRRVLPLPLSPGEFVAMLEWHPGQDFAEIELPPRVTPFSAVNAGHRALAVASQFCELTAEQSVQAVRSVRAALEGVHRANPVAWRAVAVAIEEVVVAGAPGTDCIQAGSDGQSVARVWIANANLQTEPFDLLADTLVHEAIHQLAFAQEEHTPFLEPSADRFMPQTSPWSGRVLPLHSWVHACLVWFGLLAFWEGAVEQAFPVRAVKARRDAALRGFCAPTFGLLLERARESLTPYASLALSLAAERARVSARPSTTPERR